MTKRKEPEQEEASTESFSNDGKSEEGPVLEVDVPGEATYWLPFHILRKHPASLLAYLVNEKNNMLDAETACGQRTVKVTGQGPFDPIFDFYRTGKLTKPEGTSWKKLREVFEFYQLPDVALPLSTRAKLASGCVLENLVETTIAPEIEKLAAVGCCSASFYFATTQGSPLELKCIPERLMQEYLSSRGSPATSFCVSKSTRATLATILRDLGFSAVFYLSTAFGQFVTRSPCSPLPDRDYHVLPLDAIHVPGYGQAYEVHSQPWQGSQNPGHLLIISW